jgi:hypothetical protein
MSFVVIGLSLLLVAVVATYAAVSLNELTAKAMPPAMGTAYALLADNPELMVARRSMVVSNAARLAANPELMVAGRYIPPGGWTRRSPRYIPLHNTVDPNRDIGLLEFFRPQAKEASTADLLHNKVDPDRDIGLLEFFKPQTVQAVAEGHTYPLLGGR